LATLDEDVTEIYEQRFVIGDNFLDTVAKNMVRSDYKKITEVMSNCIDAGATKIYLTINDKLFRCMDDGSGMKKDDIAAFCRAGDSNKVIRRENGETGLLGWFVFASVLIPTLGPGYSIRTVSEEANYGFSEKFPEGKQSADRTIEVKRYRMDGKPHGTTLRIENPSFQKGFNLTSLKKIIQREFSPFREYRIFINKKELKPKGIENAIKIHYEQDIPLVGKTKGIFYITHRPVPADSGIFLYVNGRKVADPKTLIDVGSIKNVLKNRLIGQIFIIGGGLEDSILVHREGFADTESYRSMVAYLTEAVKDVRCVFDATEVDTKIDTVLEKGRGGLQAKLKKLIRRGAPEINESIKISYERFGSDEYPITFGHDAQMIMVNLDHPRMKITAKTSPVAFKQPLLDETINAIALHRAETESRHFDFEIYQDTRAEYYKYLNNRPALVVQEAEEQIHDRVIYQLAEARKFAGVSLGDMRYMVQTGIVPSYSENEVLGRELKTGIKDMKNKVTLYHIAKKLHENPLPVHIKKLERAMDDAGEYIRPFAQAVENEKGTAYLIDELAVPLFEEIMDSKGIQATKKRDYNAKGVFQMLNHRYHNTQDLEKAFNLNGFQADEVIEYAQANEIPLLGKDNKYSLLHFFLAAVRYRNESFENAN